MAHANWLNVCAAMLGMATVGAAPVAAQSRSQPRVEISANVGALGTATFTGSDTLISNGGEPKTITVEHAGKTSLGFNVGAAVRIAAQFWVGVQYAMADTRPSASIEARIPHPILFDAPRMVEGSIEGVAHNEQNVHIDLMYALPVRAVDLKLMGGPTWFNLIQNFVSDVSINETYPFDTATFAGAATKRLSSSALGFNVGMDVSRSLTSHLGLGGLIRYSRADVKFDDSSTRQGTVKAGGVEVTAGVRLRF
jgi:opacity protein-like surface antigen